MTTLSPNAIALICAFGVFLAQFLGHSNGPGMWPPFFSPLLYCAL